LARRDSRSRLGNDQGWKSALAIDELRTLSRLAGWSLPPMLQDAAAPAFAHGGGGTVRLSEREPDVWTVNTDASPLAVDVSAIVAAHTAACAPPTGTELTISVAGQLAPSSPAKASPRVRPGHPAGWAAQAARAAGPVPSAGATLAVRARPPPTRSIRGCRR